MNVTKIQRKCSMKRNIFLNKDLYEKYKKELKSTFQVAISVQTRVVAARAAAGQHLDTTINNFKINKEEEGSFS